MSKLVLYSDESQLTRYKSYKSMNKIFYYWFINLYLGKSAYSPHFDKIFVLYDDYELESIQMIFNMLNINGKLYIIKNDKYKDYFPNYKIKKDFLTIIKKNNIQYTIPTYRTVEFIIGGVQSSIADLLTYNLSNHPDIYINTDSDPTISQTHFYDINWQNGIDYYKSYFDYSKKIVGEKTPSLLYLKHTFPLIYSVNPHVKIIIVLFNPANRAFYNWIMLKEKWNYTKSFEEAIEDDIYNRVSNNINFYTATLHIVKKGFYYDQLIELFKWFPRYNILILLEEDILKNKDQEFKKIANFLNVDDDKFSDIIIDDKIKHYKIEEVFYNKLINIYRDDILKLENLLNIKTNWI